MDPRVRILNVSHIPVPPPPYPPPGEIVPLSLFDTSWIAYPPIQRLFLFPDADRAIPFSSVVGSLRSALARTLPSFHPFAGELVYRQYPGDLVVDCSSATAGVALIEAAADLDVHRLVKEDTHDSYFLRLVPDIAALELPAPVMAVQLTAFTGGGVVVGLAVHHAVADGKGFWQFVDALAAASRAEGDGGSAHDVPVPVATHDRAVIRVPGGDVLARRFMEQMAPTIPRIKYPVSPSSPEKRLTRRTFTLDSAAVQTLKQRALHQSTAVSGDGSGQMPAPSTFVSLSAHAWVSVARTKGLTSNDDATVLAFLIDCRPRLNPPVPASFAGNCVRSVFVRVSASEFAEADGHARACKAIKLAVQEAEKDPLKGCERWVEEFMALPQGRTVIISGSPTFRVYETDFGWGKPGRVELVSMNHDGEVVLVAGKQEQSVQASVALPAKQMDKFAKFFLDGLQM